eukprot:gnl/Dysnectes_brevis/2417_a2867_1671.p1 GENE.gnl/Dysnectes_brevis/2417_a2867_1671~~gnl/Dysnectes_brevis/2417_a2867_1671.p1  ORF type:complete len:868 (-),score=115.52 gnl/Dysnectes_brevis/2417_a2867_1671:75-2465(-)
MTFSFTMISPLEFNPGLTLAKLEAITSSDFTMLSPIPTSRVKHHCENHCIVAKQPEMKQAMKQHPYQTLLHWLENPKSAPIFRSANINGVYVRPAIVVDDSSGTGKSQLAFTLMAMGYYVCYLPTSPNQSAYMPCANVFKAFKELICVLGLDDASQALVMFCHQTAAHYECSHNEGVSVSWMDYWISVCSDVKVEHLFVASKHLAGQKPAFKDKPMILFVDEVDVGSDIDIVVSVRTAARTYEYHNNCTVLLAGTAMSFINLVNMSLGTSSKRISREDHPWAFTLFRLPRVTPASVTKFCYTREDTALAPLLMCSRPIFSSLVTRASDHTLSDQENDLNALFMMVQAWCHDKGITNYTHGKPMSPVFLTQIGHTTLRLVRRSGAVIPVERMEALRSSCVHQGLMTLGRDGTELSLHDHIGRWDVYKPSTLSVKCISVYDQESHLRAARQPTCRDPVTMSSLSVSLPAPKNDLIGCLLSPTMVPAWACQADEKAKLVDHVQNYQAALKVHAMFRPSLCSEQHGADFQFLTNSWLTAASWTRFCSFTGESPLADLPWVYPNESSPLTLSADPFTLALTPSQYLQALCFQAGMETDTACDVLNKLGKVQLRAGRGKEPIMIRRHIHVKVPTEKGDDPERTLRMWAGLNAEDDVSDAAKLLQVTFETFYDESPSVQRDSRERTDGSSRFVSTDATITNNLDDKMVKLADVSDKPLMMVCHTCCGEIKRPKRLPANVRFMSINWFSDTKLWSCINDGPTLEDSFEDLIPEDSSPEDRLMISFSLAKLVTDIGECEHILKER